MPRGILRVPPEEHKHFFDSNALRMTYCYEVPDKLGKYTLIIMCAFIIKHYFKHVTKIID